MSGLHPQLQQDSHVLGHFRLCQLLLLKDANYPWFILVPDREAVTEIFQLSSEDQLQLIKESSILSRALFDVFNADKMNVAAIGNLVPQLHIHHIVRYRDDACWPAPVWGAVAKKNYTYDELDAVIKKVSALNLPDFQPRF